MVAAGGFSRPALLRHGRVDFDRFDAVEPLKNAEGRSIVEPGEQTPILFALHLRAAAIGSSTLHSFANLVESCLEVEFVTHGDHPAEFSSRQRFQRPGTRLTAIEIRLFIAVTTLDVFSHAVLFQRFEAVGFFVGNQGEDSEIPAGLLEGGVIEGNVELPALHPLDDQIGVDQALRLGREELKAGKQLLSECIERSAQLRDQRFASLRIAEKVVLRKLAGNLY